MPALRRTNEMMFPLVERYLASGQTQKAFTTEHDLTINMLNYWLAKYRRQSAPGEHFQEITPATDGPEHALLEICFPGGIRLRLFSLLPPDYLADVLAARLR